jgi:hypothetical protein
VDAVPLTRLIKPVAAQDSRMSAAEHELASANARRAKTPRPLAPASRTSTSWITRPA